VFATPPERWSIDSPFLGLVEDDGGVAFTVERRLARPDLRLFGGTAIAVALALVERRTGREALWATAQLVGTAPVGSTVVCVVDELARGHRTSQVRVTATADGDVVFVALGAAADLKDPETSIVGEGAVMPRTPPPESCPAVFTAPGVETTGWHSQVDMRLGGEGEDGRLCLWMRMVDGAAWTPARLAFVADMVPVAVCRAGGVRGAGTSLDNTLRMGRPVDTEWVLLDLLPHVAWGGYGTGTGLLWAEDGTLVAVASQTSSVFALPFDPLDLERLMMTRTDL
jgi:acyl-CoA thioesterase-2